MGGMRRRGIQLLLVVLPDGTRSLIPANWTDWAATRVGDQSSATSETRAEKTLGTLSDLLNARTIVDALLSRSPSLRPKPAIPEESYRATDIGDSRSSFSAGNAARSARRRNARQSP